MAIPRAKTSLDDELIFGVDLKNRRISFGSPLTASQTFDNEGKDTNDFSQLSVEGAVRAIRRMEKDQPQKPIELYMNSFGGEPYSMLYLVDVILSSTCQFKFFGGGAIMSSASWVMAVCDERYLYPNTKVMLHDGSADVSGTIKDINIQVEEENRLMDRLYRIYAENSRMPEAFWREVCSRDLYLWAEEALILGLIDGIIPYKKRGNLRKKRLAGMADVPPAKTMKSLVKKLFDRVKIKISVKDFNINIPQEDEIDPEIVIDETPIVEEQEGQEEVADEMTNINELIGPSASKDD